MNKITVVTIALIALCFAQTASAACNETCQMKCNRSAASGGMTVPEYIQLWSYINAHYKAQTTAISNGYWNKDLCVRKCQIVWRSYKFKSAKDCELNIPCSQY